MNYLSQADYCEQLKAYHNSPQFQSFLSNSSRKKRKTLTYES